MLLLQNLPYHTTDMRNLLRRLSDYHFSPEQGALVYMAAYFVSAGLGVVRQALFTARFGITFEAEAYFAAVRLPETLAIVVAGGTLTNALVPVVVALRRRAGDAAASALIGQVLSAILVFIAPFLLLAALFAPQLIATVVAPGFNPETAALTAALTRLMLFEVLLIVSEGVLVAELVSRNRLFLPMLAIMLRNTTLILGVGAAYLFPEIGIWGPTIGSLGDALIQLLIFVPALRRAKIGLQPWQWRNPDLREVFALLWPNSLSALTNYLNNLLDSAFASFSRWEGGLALLYNAYLLFGLPVRLIGTAIGQAALPHIAAAVAEGETRQILSQFRRATAVGLGLSLLAMFALMLLGRPLIGLIFERGAFGAQAAERTFSLLFLLSFSLPASVLAEIGNRTLIAYHDTRRPFIANLVQLFLRGLLLWWLSPSFDLFAIPLASLVAATVETVLLIVWAARRANRHETLLRQ